MPFGCFAKTRIKRIVVADPQRRGLKGWGVVCGDAAPCVGHKMKGAGNVNKVEWWAVVFDIVRSVSARECGWGRIARV